MSTIVVHHLEHSRSQRVLWLLEELGLAYEIKHYARDRRFRAPPELRDVHPLGKAPMVSIDGVVTAESALVLEAILDHAAGGGLRPEPGTDAFRWYQYWLHYAEGSLMPPLLVKLIAGRVKMAPVPFFLRWLVRRIGGQIDSSYADPELALHGRYLEAHLGEHAWFTGDAFTAADILLSYPIEAGSGRGPFGEGHPRLAAWLERIHARPAYQRALERGGPYTLNGA